MRLAAARCRCRRRRPRRRSRRPRARRRAGRAAIRASAAHEAAKARRRSHRHADRGILNPGSHSISAPWTSRAALITGGSSGIGLAIARALGQDGYAVTISARRPDKLEAAAAGAARGGHRRRGGRRQHGRRGRDQGASWPRTASAAAASTCSSTTPASGSARPVADSRDQEARHPARREPARRLPHGPRGDPDAQGGRRRARQGADGQHGLDRRQARPGLAVGLLGDEVRRGRPQPGRCTRSWRATASRSPPCARASSPRR